MTELINQALELLWTQLNFAYFFKPLGLNPVDLAQFILIVATFPIAFATKPLFNKVKPADDAPLPPANPIWLRPIFFTRKAAFEVNYVGMWMLLLLISWEALRFFEFPKVYTLTAALIAACWTAIRLIPLLPVEEKHRRWLAIAIWAVLALSFTNQLGSVISFMNNISVNLGASKISLWAAIKAVALFIGLIMLASRASNLLEANMKSRRVSPNARALILKFSNISALILAGLFALDTLGLDLSALTIFGGAFGLGLGFGMRTILGNYISGVILLLDKSISPGDVIAINSTYGVITEMHARYVVMRTRSGEETLIPNENLLTSEVTNWSFTNRAIRQEITVGVSYDSDMEQVQKVIKEAIRDHRRVLDSPVPRVFIKEFGDSSVVFLVRYWQKDPEEGVFNLKGDLQMRIWKAFKENKIQIPFPQRVLHMNAQPNLFIDPDEGKVATQDTLSDKK